MIIIIDGNNRIFIYEIFKEHFEFGMIFWVLKMDPFGYLGRSQSGPIPEF